MKIERYTLVAVTLALVVGSVSLIVPGQRFDIPAVDATGLLAASLWATTVLFAAATVVWLVLTYVVGQGYDIPEAVHGGENVQVRILTIDSASVVQQTVDSLPDELVDVHVIAECDVDIENATVHVVPEEFECSAVRKGRALEWARQHVHCDREFVLYLDEDSIVETFAGLPDADVVQLREKPRRTGSVLSYLADVFRMGVQLEQRAFARLSIPLFAWGGGIAVRKTLEDEVTWDRETLVEDTAFVWAAAQEHDIDFELADVICRNEAPPSLGEILQQRRRWAAGNLRAAKMLPLHYRALTRFRNSAWALSPIVTLVVVPLSVLGITVVSGGLFALASLGLAVATLFWYLRGVAYYGGSKLKWALAVPLTPVVTLVHSMGTVLGVVDPPDDFRVTEKAGTEDDD